MNEVFCTITTATHMHKVLALNTSLQKFDSSKLLHVLCVDDVDKEVVPSNVVLHFLSDIMDRPYVRELLMKYEDADRRRWVLKPVFIAYLLSKAEKVIYVDNDIYFFDAYQFLFDGLDTDRMLLTPHWRCINPFINEDYFIVNYTDGVYNAGFVAANRGAVDILDAWALMCNYRCEKNKEKGLWDDQKYLDLLPSRFEGIGTIRHRGCNVAVWNKHDNLRTATGDTILINRTYPIVFIHFTNDTIADIKENRHGGDPMLKPFLDTYEAELAKSAKVLNHQNG